MQQLPVGYQPEFLAQAADEKQSEDLSARRTIAGKRCFAFPQGRNVGAELRLQEGARIDAADASHCKIG
jgi:hypothetical protein